MTINEVRAQRDMEHAMDRLQTGLRDSWRRGSLPRGWNGLDSLDGILPHKTRVTIRLDADMVKWFRALGPNYSQRMNDVLRIYWKALMSGHIHAYYFDDPAINMRLDCNDRAREIEKQQRAETQQSS